MTDDAGCKPGGCSRIGCEGGHYCFNADGAPRSKMSEQKQQELTRVFDRIFRDDNEKKADA